MARVKLKYDYTTTGIPGTNIVKIRYRSKWRRTMLEEEEERIRKEEKEKERRIR